MKKLFYVLFVLLFCAFFLHGCSNGNTNSPKEVRGYDLLNIKEEMSLKFSDLVEDIRIVPLESGADFLIPDGDYLVNDKYIVVINRKAMHQFDVNTGKHIRLLAIAGNGPNEFNYLNSYTIFNDKLYYGMVGKENLYVIDLNTGAHLQPFPVKYDYFSFQGVFGDEELYVANDSLLFERYHVKTQQKRPVIDTLKGFVNLMPGEGGFNYGSPSLSGSYVAMNQDEVFFYHKNYSDTLYLDGPQGVVPYACLTLPEDQMAAAAGETTSGKQFLLKVPYIDSDKIFCSVLGIDIQTTANTVSATLVPQGLYCIDRQKGDAKVVTKYLFDPLFEYEFVEGDKRDENSTYLASVLFGFNNYAVNKDVYAVAAAAYKVKEYIRLSLENPDFPADKKAQLRELDNQLDEDGNPVVFIGKKK